MEVINAKTEETIATAAEACKIAAICDEPDIRREAWAASLAARIAFVLQSCTKTQNDARKEQAWRMLAAGLSRWALKCKHNIELIREREHGEHIPLFSPEDAIECCNLDSAVIGQLMGEATPPGEANMPNVKNPAVSNSQARWLEANGMCVCCVLHLKSCFCTVSGMECSQMRAVDPMSSPHIGCPEWNTC